MIELNIEDIENTHHEIECPYCHHKNVIDDWNMLSRSHASHRMECENCGHHFNFIPDDDWIYSKNAEH